MNNTTCKALYFCVLFLALLIGGCQIQRETQGVSADKNPSLEYCYSVHPQFRMWNTPCEDMKVEYNPPVLKWVVDTNADYSVRLSQSEEFPSEKTIHAENFDYPFYNPHVKLTNGKWYWQVKSANGKWSETSSFVVDDSAIEYVTPAGSELKNMFDYSRPRILIRKNEIEDFRKRTLNLHESKNIIKEADGFLNVEPSMKDEETLQFFMKKDLEMASEKYVVSLTDKLEKDFSQLIGDSARIIVEHLSQAYVLTGDEKYIKPAIIWAMIVANYDPDGITHISDFGDSGCMLAMAYVYDTFYDNLHPDEKEKIRKALKARIMNFYDLWINNIDAKVISNHVWQHIMHRLILSIEALMGDDPDAEKLFSYVYEFFIARVPVLGGSDGAWSNGVSYYNMNGEMLLDIPLLFEEITGANYFKNKFYKNNSEWLWYSFPPGSHTDGFCNDSRKWDMPGLEVIGFADAFARITGNKYAAYYASECSKMSGVSVEDNTNYRWLRLRRALKYDLPEYNSEELVFSNGRTFPEIGVAYMNTYKSNLENNIMVSFRSALFGGASHAHADQNNFNILTKGEYLFSNTGYRISMGDPHYLACFKSTLGHNTVLINGKDQPFSGNAWGWIPRSIHTADLQYVVGDASKAYDDHYNKKQKELSGLQYYRRHMLLLKPNIIVVYDVLDADKPVEWNWMLHGNNPIVEKEKLRWETDNNNSVGEVSFFSSRDVAVNITDTFKVKVVQWRIRVANRDYPNQWHLRASNIEKSKSVRYLAVFRINDKDNSVDNKSLKISSDGSIDLGEWIVKTSLDEAHEGLLEAYKKDGSLSFVSGGDNIKFNGKSYEGKIPGSAKLMMKDGGKIKMKESSDLMPRSLREAAFVQKSPLVQYKRGIKD